MSLPDHVINNRALSVKLACQKGLFTPVRASAMISVPFFMPPSMPLTIQQYLLFSVARARTVIDRKIATKYYFLVAF